MSTICARKPLEIPPRKLLPQMSFETRSTLPNFLPSNNCCEDNIEHDTTSDPYATDHFRMYEFKVRRCTRSRSHDWTDCPFAHPGEKALRRDPRRFRYSATVCADFRRGGGGCPRGNDCEFAHGVFECWLHPTRYRTEACKDGKNCQRKVCFFAHSPRELRLLPAADVSLSPKYSKNSKINNNHCCLFCRSGSVTSSPTSTLLGGLSHLSRSPSLSPPLSPVRQFSPISRYGDRFSKFAPENMTTVSYKDVLKELMNLNIQRFDVCFNGSEDQQQFVMSPSSSRPSPSRCAGVGEKYFPFGANDNDHQKIVDENNQVLDPDLGWVNELLM